MKHYYFFICLCFCTIITQAQHKSENLYVDKAWVLTSEEWNDFYYQGKIVFSTMPKEGDARITNFDLLYDLCGGLANFVDKKSYTSAVFESRSLVSEKTDKKGIKAIAYEGLLVFKSGVDYYSTNVIVSFLEKGKLVGFKIRNKNNNKEYAFSFKSNG